MKNLIKIIIANTFILATFCQRTIAQDAFIGSGSLPNELYISTFWYCDADYYYALFRSTDNGKNLSMQKIITEEEYPIFGRPIADSMPGYVYSNSNTVGEGLYFSQDYGKTWNQNNTLFASYFGSNKSGNIFSFFQNSDIRKLKKSNDFGITFTMLKDSCIFSKIINGYNISEFYGLIIHSNKHHEIVYTNNDFASLNILPIDTTVAYNYYAYTCPQLYNGTQPGEVFLLSWWLYEPNPSYIFYRIFRSSDYGNSFQFMYESDTIDYIQWTAIEFASGKTPGSFYALRQTLDPTCVHSWVYIDYIYNYGENAVTYFHDLDLSVGINEPSKTNGKLLSNSPNPFTSQTSVNFTLPKETEVNINVTSLQGVMVKKIRLGKCTAGYHSYSLDGSDLPQGMYLCTLFANGEKVQTVKMIKAE